MTTEPTPQALIARLGASEPSAGELVAEVRTEAMLPFFHDPGNAAQAGGIRIAGPVSAIVAVTAEVSWRRAAALQDWLTDRRGADALATNETELAEFVSDTLFAGGDLAGTARYLGTFILAGRARRSVRMLIGLTRPVSEAQYAAAWAKALAELKAASPDRFARIRAFLTMLLEEETVKVEKLLLLSAVGDLIGHSIATGPAGA
jgi:hypothetical protein